MWVTALSIFSTEAASGESKIWVKDRGPRTCDPKVASNLFNGPRSRKGLPSVEQTRGQRQTGHNDLPGKGERVAEWMVRVESKKC